MKRVHIRHLNYYRATSDFGGELEADRYAEPARLDHGFVSASHPGLVLFPVFEDDKGRWGGRPTFATWKAFCVHLSPALGPAKPDPDAWLTFAAPDTDADRVPVILSKYLKAGRPATLGVPAVASRIPAGG